LLCFAQGVLAGEVEISAAWHYQAPGFNPLQGGAEIVVPYRVGADVALLPGVQHGKQIVGVLLDVVLFPVP
jgi:hypothetical protein